jgi:hypothetical protein
MKSKDYIYQRILLLPLVVAIVVLAACQRAEEIDEAAATLDAELQMTVRPEPSPTPTEAAAEDPTEEPTEEATQTVEPTATVEPKISFADLEEVVSVTGFFAVKVPAGWSTEEAFPGGAFVMANSLAALDNFTSRGTVESGDLVLNIGFLPFELFRQREVVPLNIQFGAPPDVFMQSVLPIFRAAGDADLSDVELVSISDERDAGMVTISEEGTEGFILMFTAGDEVVAVVSAVSSVGEMATLREDIFAIASEVTFSGDQGALYGTLLEG